MAANMQDVAQRMRDIKIKLDQVPLVSERVSCVCPRRSGQHTSCLQLYAALSQGTKLEVYSLRRMVLRGVSMAIQAVSGGLPASQAVIASDPQPPDAEAAPDLQQRHDLLDELLDIVEDVNFARCARRWMI